MRILVYEYLCGGGYTGPAAPSLYREGAAMLSALVEDLARSAALEPCTLLAQRCPLVLPGIGRRFVPGRDDESSALRALAAECDAALVIAPEDGGILLDRCRWVRAAGCIVLGPTEETIALTADKLALGNHWQQQGVPVPTTCLLESAVTVSRALFPAVVKPRYGAGTEATCFVGTKDELPLRLNGIRGEGYVGPLLAQRFAAGRPASVAFLVGPRGTIPLLPAEQTMQRQTKFEYLGGRLPLPGRLGGRATALARRAVAAVTGLLGYVGVDLILGERPDDDVVLEINPRLTTSYIALRAVARTNLAEALVRVALGHTAALNWGPGQVRFRKDGVVEGLAGF